MDSAAPLPDYYKTLGISSSGTAAEIKEAYRRESLRCHPDRFPNASPTERERYTARFQSVADAYYVLSDPSRRASYDVQRQAQSTFGGGSAPDFSSFFGSDGDYEKEQSSSANFFSNFFRNAQAAGGFGGSQQQRQHEEQPAHDPADEAPNANGQPNAEGVFGSVFEELLRPEVKRVAPLWTWVGSASGAAMGFIVGSVPGAIGGAVVGNRLGAIRDAKGKSVAQVFSSLGAGQKAEVLRALAMKVLGSMSGR